jgi:hypothetical protein
LLALALLVYGRLLAPGRVPYSPFSDLLPAHLPLKDVLWSQAWPPLWRSDVMLGAPALTEPQALYLHPLQLAFWLLPPLRAFGPTLVLELWVAALGAYALARVLGCGLRAGLVAGVAQLVSFKWLLAAYAGWSSVLGTLCLLPAIAAALLHLAGSPSLGRALAFCGLLAAALSGATPQTLYYLGLLLGPCALLLAHRRGGGVELLRVLGWSGSALLLAFACTAYLWLPLVAELPLLARVDQAGYDHFLSGHGLGLRHLLTLLWPEALGTPLHRSYPGHELWEAAAYFGIVPLFGVCLLTVKLRSAPGVQRILVIVFWLSLLLSLQSPLLELAYHALPGYAVFRLPGRMLFVTAVLGVALGACALEPWLRARSSRSASAIAGVLALLILLEGGVHASRYLETVRETDLLPAADHPVRRLEPAPNARIAVVGRAVLNYGWAQPLGIRLVNGYGPYSFAHYKRFMDLAANGSWRDVPLSNWFDLQTLTRVDLLAEAAVETVIAKGPLSSPKLELVARRDAVRSFVFYRGMAPRTLYHYRIRAPRAFARFASGVLGVDSAQAMADAVQRGELAGQAFVLGLAPREAARLRRPGGSAVVERSSPGRIRVRTARSEAGLLVVAEAWHPGWRALVGGKPASVHQVNVALMGVRVPEGDQTVELRFVPLHFEAAVRISVAAGLLLLILAAARVRARLKARWR